MADQDECTIDNSDYYCCANQNERTNFGTEIEQCSQTLLEYLDLAFHDVALLFGINL